MSTDKIKRAGEKGFTLVELSIVILIIGLLIAGIAAGTQMIRQAELRSIISDFYNFTIAYNNFQTKYKAVPGDFNAAASFFPTGCVTGTATGCNGSGDGLIDYDASSPGTSEVNLAWQHLALAKVLGGSFTAVDKTLATTIIGTNAPQSKRVGLGYILINDAKKGINKNGTGAPAAVFEADRNVIFLGKAEAATTLFNSALSPEDAFNIDQKMDDAYADTTGTTVFRGSDTGVVRAKNGDDGTTAPNTCIVTVSSSNSYNVGVSPTPTACRLGASVN
ncbi:MAG: prepilin-type N-terminal cleavage/methylation domain-containing protein [Proteobacteria bacterium]|nr:prepilin-type N-terminal cleavage/methylation domain-containing protein [Pseudomonadota bacterium]